MSLESMCSGDRVRRLTVSGGTFGNTPVFVEGDAIECRIDISTGSESSDTGAANELRTGSAFFSKNPRLKVGHYLRLLTHGCEPVVPPILLRVVSVDDAEGRPGDTPWLWTATVREDKQSGLAIRNVQEGQV